MVLLARLDDCWGDGAWHEGAYKVVRVKCLLGVLWGVGRGI